MSNLTKNGRQYNNGNVYHLYNITIWEIRGRAFPPHCTSSSKRASTALGGLLEVNISPRVGLPCGVVARTRLSEWDPSGRRGMCK